jgi:hypothetical protein
VRNFRSVVEDICPDDAFIVTCTGYTAHAQRYAKAKGVKLAVLRAHEDFDWEGYIRRVSVELHAQGATRIDRLELNLDQPEADAFLAQTQAAGIGMRTDGSGVRFRDSEPVFLVSSAERLQVCAFLWREVNARMVGLYAEITLDPNEWKLQVGDNEPIRFTRLRITASNRPPVIVRFEAGLDRMAELVLKGFGGRDLIIFADQLQTATFEEVSRVADQVRAHENKGPPLRSGRGRATPSSKG